MLLIWVLCFLDVKNLSNISDWDLSSKPKKYKIFYEVPADLLRFINQEKFLDFNIESKKFENK